jgi:adenylate kinase family enzyme
MLQRVMVMGGPGSGKSTFAREIGETLDLPVYHLDRYFWKPGWVQSGWDEFATHVREIAEGDQWVIDGNYSRVLTDRLARTDTVVYLDLPLWVRLPRVIKRSIKYHGRTRYDLGDDCPERIDWTFLKQVVQYNHDHLLQALSAAHDVQGTEVPIFQLRSTAEVEQFLAQIADSR